MKVPAIILATAMLSACAGNLRTLEPARYDFGNVSGDGSGSRIPLAAIEVQAASWLSGPAMNFRLAYAQPQRRQTYTESRWAAPPAELLEAFLKRRMAFGQPGAGGEGCRLQLVLDELEQRFDDPQQSRAVIEVSVLLAPPRGAEIISRRLLAVSKSAATADARGGAAATRDAVQLLAADLTAWLAELVREKPAIIERCRT